MTEPSRQQRRRHNRELARLGETAIKRGMAPNPDRDTMTGAVLMLVAKLAERDNPRRASECAAMAHALFEASLKAFPARETLACKKGCGYCCHGFVAVTAPEAFRLARTIREAARADPLLAPDAVLERARPLFGLDARARFGRQLPCPLLREGACSTYAARPIMCRKVVSVALAPCLDEHAGRDGVMSIPGQYLAHASNGGVALLAAMEAGGYATTSYELAGAVSAAVTVPDAEARWLAGHAVFAGLQTAPAPLPAIQQAVAALAAAAHP